MKKGSKHSPEARQKMSESRKGEKHYFFGKHHTEESKKKIGETQKGRHHSEETRAKISVSNKGRHVSEESRKKMGESRKGDKNHMFGKHPTEETLQKMGESQKGRHHSKESRKKMSESRKNRWITDETRQRTSATLQGIPYEEWIEFVNEKKYCKKFNKDCRESNRDKYNRECFICGKPEKDNVTKSGKMWKLSVHHVDMNRDQGCTADWKLVPLCIHCHATAHNKVTEARIEYLLRDEIYDNQ